MTEVDYKKVLVAEDSSVIQNLLKKILLFENCKITSAKDGQVAFDKFENDDFDLLKIISQKDDLRAGNEIQNRVKLGFVGFRQE